MKRKGLFIIVCLCVLSVNVFAQEARQINRVPVSWDVVEMLVNSKSNLNELNYFLSVPLTILIDDKSIDPSFQINNGNLLYSDQYLNLIKVDLNINHQGRLHIFYDTPGNEIFEVIFVIQNRYVTIRFKRNVHLNNFIAFSAIINGRPYSLSSETELPILMIGSNFNLR